MTKEKKLRAEMVSERGLKLIPEGLITMKTGEKKAKG